MSGAGNGKPGEYLSDPGSQTSPPWGASKERMARSGEKGKLRTPIYPPGRENQSGGGRRMRRRADLPLGSFQIVPVEEKEIRIVKSRRASWLIPRWAQ